MYFTIDFICINQVEMWGKQRKQTKWKIIAAEVLDATTSCLLDWLCIKLCLRTDLIVRI